jgi:hypothetical protein
MTITSHNCIVCAEEFESEDIETMASNDINSTRFKICQYCLDKCDPSDDFRQVRSIVDSYLKFAETKSLFKEAQAIVDSVTEKS